MVPAPFIVVVDANALFPLTLRDTLLRAAAAGFYQLQWSEVILYEMERNLVSTDTMSAEKAIRLRQHMERFFPEALVTDFERLVDSCPTTRRTGMWQPPPSKQARRSSSPPT